MLFVLILVFSSWAKDCSPVNLAAPGNIHQDIPVFDQVGSQICFSYAAMQLIESQRVSLGHKYTQEAAISPLSMALGLAYSNGQKNLQQGSTPCRAIEYARTHEVCPEGKTFKSSEEIIEHSKQFSNCKSDSAHPDCKKVLKIVSKESSILKQDNPLAYVLAVENSMCSPADKIKLDIPKCENLNDESQPSSVFKQKVDAVFDSSNPRPVQIGYSMHIFSYDGNEKEKYKILREVNPDVIDFSLKYKPHASILLGRRLNKKNKCQYLLRNTMGSSFCPSGIVDKRGWECDSKSGGIWINQDEIFDATFEVSSIGGSPNVGQLIEKLEKINTEECKTCSGK
ncbi:MAG: hypothetical protein K2P81_10365 [Bacteriovoracaceae bacterium]|nr:hypothetical protein [Bacteriovoracaceae bacterium]